jgi:hypothetical protein
VVFSDNYITAQLSADPFCIPITLDLHQIISANKGCFQISNLSFQATKSMKTPSRPLTYYGIRNITVDKLEKQILQYINTVSNCPLLLLNKTICGDTPEITWKMLAAICRFHNTNPIVRKGSIYLM